MINSYSKNTIGYKLMEHDNDYDEIVFTNDNYVPSLSIVIPYFEAWNTINQTLEYLFKSCRKIYPEIILVDDGSIKYPAEKVIERKFIEKLRVVKLSSNQGRSTARNCGIKETKGEVVAFMDADMLVPPNLIDQHLRIHNSLRNKGRCGITFSLFNNLSMVDWATASNKMILFDQTNDFRYKCDYQANWIGCESDEEFIGSKYRILEETNNLRKWPRGKSFGPWLLPNMILGGFFYC